MAKTTKRTAKATTRKAPATRSASRRSVPKPSVAVQPKARVGLISHTELATSDPAATKAWASEVLGWRFNPPVAMPVPGGAYHMWSTPGEGGPTGGGVFGLGPGESPRVVPYVEVASVKATFEKALRAGAKESMPPLHLREAGGWIAVVTAPGGVQVGLWSPKE